MTWHSISRTICCVFIRTDGGGSGPSLVLSMCLRSGTGRPDTADTASWLSRTHGTMPLTLLHIRQHSHTTSSSIFSRQAWGKSVEDHLSNQTIFHCIALFHCLQPLYYNNIVTCHFVESCEVIMKYRQWGSVPRHSTGYCQAGPAAPANINKHCTTLGQHIN